MPTSTISNTILDPSGGTTVPQVTVTARLKPGPGFRVSDSSEVAGQISTTSSNDSWSLALERNSNITPANSYWEITEDIGEAFGGPRVYAISVGAANATLLASIVNPTTDTTLATYLTQAAGDARYTAIGSGAASNVVHVDSHGADPTGVADSTAAFEAARTALPSGGVIMYGPGTYKCGPFDLSTVGLTLRGASRASVIKITGSTTGLRLYQPDSNLEDGYIQAHSSFTGTDVVRAEAHTSTAINRPVIRNVRIYGNSVSGVTGLYLKGVSGGANGGVYNGTIDQLAITGCTNGIKAYTVSPGTDTPVSNLGNQFNGTMNITSLSISSCTTGILANTALQYTFVGADIESNTTGVNLDYIQSWVFVGGFGVQGNTTDHMLTAQAGPNMLCLGSVAGNNGSTDFVDKGGIQIGRGGSNNESIYPKLNPGRHPDYPGQISRAMAFGVQERVYWFDGAAATTANGPAVPQLYIPQLAEVADGAGTTFFCRARITGMAASGGDCAAYELSASFKATRSGSTITVTQIGSTTTLSSHESTGAHTWTKSFGLSGSTAFRPVAAGDVANGSIKWTFFYEVVAVRGA